VLKEGEMGMWREAVWWVAALAVMGGMLYVGWMRWPKRRTLRERVDDGPEMEPLAVHVVETSEEPIPERPAAMGSGRQPLPLARDVLRHCTSFFRVEAEVVAEAGQEVPLLLFPPNWQRGWWTYVTAGLHTEVGQELLLYSYKREPELISHLLHAAAQVREQYHQTGRVPAYDDVFSLSCPILPGSALDHLLILPPSFEPDGFSLYYNGREMIHFHMLLPVAVDEAAYLQVHGWEALERRFIQQEVNALDYFRPSVQRGRGTS